MTKLRYGNTAAARMLTDGLRSAAQERGLSLREIGRRLGYKQPVVLSHMAKGRVPVPIDRAPEIAHQVGMPPERFLEAVLHQHHPAIEWGLITGAPDAFLQELEQAARRPLSDLNAGHRRILLEMLEDQRPEERWLSIPEVAAVRFLRELFPQLPTDGLSLSDRSTLRACVELLNEQDDD